MKYKNFRYLICGIIFILAWPLASLAADKELTVALYGGSFQEQTIKCYIENFENKNGVKVNMVVGNSTDNLAKLRAQKSDPMIDVAYMDWSVAIQAKNEGLIEKLDVAKIPNIAQIYDKALEKDHYFVAQLFACTGLAYNTQFVKSPPTSWHDLWDAKYKGKIALPDITGTSGYQTLLMAARINGGDIKNLDPGFEAIKKIRNDLVTFYTHADQVVSLLERGEVWIVPWYHDRTAFAQKQGVPVAFAFPKEGTVAILPALTIVKGCPNKELAEKFINAILSAEGQKCFAVNMFEGPVNKTVVLDPELAKKMPYGPEQIDRMVVPDYEYTAEHRGEWSEKWNKEIAR
jgi:putative spermidine/putrescine transport system substrate-binding protein